MERSPQELASVNPGYWANVYQIRLQNGTFSFENHEFQREPMNNKGKRICYIKAAQSFGATLLEGLKDLWGMIYGKYKLGVIHAFPTNDEVGEFSKYYFKPLIQKNYQTIGRFVRDTDTASLKKVRDAFLFLRGARLSQKIGDTDEDTSSKTAGFSVDRIVYDEVDFMDMAVIEKLKGRYYHSPIQEEVYLGNPSHEDYGIDAIFKTSDQRYWYRKCTKCGKWTCAEKTFPNCVHIDRKGKGHIVCVGCGAELPIYSGPGTGQWVPDYPTNSDYMQGYHLSRLTNIYTDPAQIIADLENPPNNNLADVYRLQLGRAYSSESDKLRIPTVLACCSQDIMLPSDKGPCAMGVDVGKKKHIVIGKRVGNDLYKIVFVMQFTENMGQILHDLIRRYNVTSAVIDLRPYEDEARLIQKQERIRLYLCEYEDNLIHEAIWNENTMTVKVHRTGIFDSSHRHLSNRQIILPAQCPDVEMYAKQCCNCARFEEKNKRSGAITYRYRDTGDKKIGSHYRSATNYFLLAASGTKLALANRNDNRSTQTDNSYSRI